MYRKFNHHQSHHFHDKKLDTQGAETPRFPSSSETSAPRPKGFASSVRLSRAPPPLLQFARPLFNRLSAFSTVHHPSLHLPFVLVYFFQFIRARFYPVARSSSSGSSLPSLRFLPAFDLSAPLIRIYRGRIFFSHPLPRVQRVSPYRLQWNFDAVCLYERSVFTGNTRNLEILSVVSFSFFLFLSPSLSSLREERIFRKIGDGFWDRVACFLVVTFVEEISIRCWRFTVKISDEHFLWNFFLFSRRRILLDSWF